ncbi:adenylyl-sulfate kinase [Marinomonas ostreistagni]|uniref:Adenylyl-sulfate kinase n=2 Tax=Marinomonas ostreistagni TaxID=359209 RepID=A0ABS0Z661_9GAMM|nr:adenylyl-sulfate kinase [Marinomonas ostreistagni]
MCGERRFQIGQRMEQNTGSIFWFTGLSGSGKTTLATALSTKLKELGYKVYLLDGDVLRTGLCNDLKFSDQDRKENIRRAGKVAKLFMDEGYIVLCTFISPFCSDRQIVRETCPNGKFHEVYVSTPLGKCEERDPKGLYAKARSGLIPFFTGIDSPYEKPNNPELEINTSNCSIDAAINYILDYVLEIKL